MNMNRKARRGGWPKRERSNVVVRMPPGLVKRVAAEAERRGMTRNEVMVRWLDGMAALVEVGVPKMFEETEVYLQGLVEVYRDGGKLPEDVAQEMMRRMGELQSRVLLGTEIAFGGGRVRE